MDAGRSPQRIGRSHVTDERADLPTDGWTAKSAGVSNVESIDGEANHDASPRRSLVARAPRPCASYSRRAVGRSTTVGRVPASGAAWSPVSSPSAAVAAPDSRARVLDVRGVPAPAHDRQRPAAPACLDRGCHGRQNQLRQVLARVRYRRSRRTTPTASGSMRVSTR